MQQYEKSLELKAETSLSHYGLDKIGPTRNLEVAYNGHDFSGL
jgi:hypothetical protein